MAKTLEEKMIDYRIARETAYRAVVEAFPVGSSVRMKTGAVATVHAHHFDNADLVDLLLENGNVRTKSYAVFERA